MYLRELKDNSWHLGFDAPECGSASRDLCTRTHAHTGTGIRKVILSPGRKQKDLGGSGNAADRFLFTERSLLFTERLTAAIQISMRTKSLVDNSGSIAAGGSTANSSFW